MYLFNWFLSLNGKTSQNKTKKTCINLDWYPNVFWNENVISYNLRIITRIFSAYKIDRKIRIFSLDRQKNILIEREYLVIMCAVMGHLYLNEFIFSSRLAKNCRKVSRPPDRTSGGSRGGARGARPPLFLNQTGPKKYFLETGVPLILGSGWPSPPSPLIWRSRSAIEDTHLNFHKMIVGERSSFRPVRSLHNTRFMNQASRMRQFVIEKIGLPLRDQMH